MVGLFYKGKNLVLTLILVLLLGAFGANYDVQQVDGAQQRDIIFQVSTIGALMQGFYDGEVSCGDLKPHGDLGIGTFAGLDGEMIVIDGQVFQVKADGKAYRVTDKVKTPFAAVTFFERDVERDLRDIKTYQELQNQLNELIPNKNLFYAFRLDGTFSYVKTRSVPKQSKPYPLLVEVTKNQPTFELKNVKGTLVGFWCPDYVNGINVPAYHLHFITEDRQYGGHLLECNLVEGKLAMDTSGEFQLVLPVNSDFGKVDLGKDSHKDLEKVEK